MSITVAAILNSALSFVSGRSLPTLYGWLVLRAWVGRAHIKQFWVPGTAVCGPSHDERKPRSSRSSDGYGSSRASSGASFGGHEREQTGQLLNRIADSEPGCDRPLPFCGGHRSAVQLLHVVDRANHRPLFAMSARSKPPKVSPGALAGHLTGNR
jgi:hypothetical protein